MRIHSASIAVSKPTPRYYTPGVGLPLHPSTSTLVMKWSLHTQTARQVKSDRSSNRDGEAPPVRPRHTINGDEYFSPAEIGKARDDIVKAARTAPQLFHNRFFYGQHGSRPPVAVRWYRGCAAYCTERAVWEVGNALELE